MNLCVPQRVRYGRTSADGDENNPRNGQTNRGQPQIQCVGGHMIANTGEIKVEILLQNRMPAALTMIGGLFVERAVVVVKHEVFALVSDHV